MALESKSSSRCTTETAKGTHVLEIVGYSLKKGLGIGKFVQSAIFTVGGYDWTIRFYPDGANMSYADCVCVSVSREPTGRGLARASCDLRLVNKDTGLPKSIWFLSQATPTEFDYGNRVFPECGGFIERSELELEGSGYIKDDSLTIECVLTVIKQSQVTKTTGSSEIKIILAARSPVFEAELYGGMKERKAESITVEDMQPAAFKALLHFVYTDSLPDVDEFGGDDYVEMIRHLLVAADRYAMDRLKLICQNILEKNLAMETLATTLALADHHNCDRLKEACIEFIASKDEMDALMATQGYSNLKRTCPSVLIDVFEKASRLRKA
uniref:Speckle-type POZ protein-like protein n=1 Tax=Aegilops tauschii TaxID=37682 RepID=N1QYH2_AEGTA